MQQHSSVPERYLSDVDATLEKAAETPAALQIQQLRADIWLERCLNQLQNHINDCLVCAFKNQKTAKESEAEIFQTVVKQLSLAFKTDSVAIALADSTANEQALKSPTTCQICYSAPTQQAQTKFTDLPRVILATGKTLSLKLGEVITLEDLQQLQNQKQQSAWPLNDAGVPGWLIATTSSLPDGESLEALKIQHTQLIERSLTAVALALTQMRRLQTLCSESQHLEARNRELVRANQLKSEFLANTSHEIRTPLSSILGFTYLLQAQGYNPDNLRQQEYLNIILTSGQHLLALINDILDLSKVEANQLEMQRELVDVPDLCRSVMALVKEKASDKGLQLRLDLDPDTTTLVADSLRLKQMLFNLLSNALKFTSQGSVGLQVKHKGVFLHFIVWDTGTGIAKEEQTQLFQPYSQIANVVVDRQEGTGLGLALTQKLAELHGGWVEVHSELNRGSKFTVVLPSTHEVVGGRTKRGQCESTSTLPLSAAPLISRSSLPLPTATAAILLVEDNIHNAKLMTTYLKKLGYQMTWVQDAAQMWQALARAQPALILMDINLPDVDGMTLVRQLKAHEQYRTIPVITQTAMAMKGDRETCLAAGAIDYISKPIDLKVLAQLVSKYSAGSTKC